jgi:8-oxo-dGTP pyrophosphatase MutT (NUDIX family)
MTGPELRLRHAARAVICDPTGRILLVRFTFPERSVWGCPGGGVEPGETHEDALRRELREEVGFELEELGPWIWTRTHLIPLFGGRWDGQVERYFVVEAEPFEPMPQFTGEQLLAEFVTGVRWWSAENLANASELVFPKRLPELLAQLRESGAPAQPIDPGI